MDDDWVKGFSENQQRHFWKNSKTNEKVWKDPSVASAKKKSKPEAAVRVPSAESSVSGAAPIWTVSFNKKLQKDVWKNSVTGKSTTKDPHAAGGDMQSIAAEEKGETTDGTAEWEEKFNKEKNKKYWKNLVTGKSTWTQPPGFGENSSKPASKVAKAASTTETPADIQQSEWEEKFNKEKNKKYWKNKVTGKSTWTQPPGVGETGTVASKAATVTPAAGEGEYEEKFSKDRNKKYWKHKVTGKATWIDPYGQASKGGDDMSVVSALTAVTSAQAPVWEEKFNKEKNKKYWKNTVTGKSTYTPPPADSSASVAPVSAASVTPASSDEWEEKFNKEKNKKYWKNKTTGKSTWIDPTKAAKKPTDEVSLTTAMTVATAAHASDWTEHFSEKKQAKYWKNTVTGKASWTPPPAVALPAEMVAAAAPAVDSEWEEKFSKEKNKKYWKNKVTGKSSWTAPPSTSLSSSSVSVSGASLPASRAASVVKAGPLKGIASFVAASAASEALLTPPDRTAALRRLIRLRGRQAAAEIDVLQFLDEFALARKMGAGVAVSESSTRVVRTFKLFGLKSITCNENLGQISIVLPVGALVDEITASAPSSVPVSAPASDTAATVAASALDGPVPMEDALAIPAPPPLVPFIPAAAELKLPECFHLLLTFQNSSVAQKWFQAVLARLDLSVPKGTDASTPLIVDHTNSDIALPETSNEELLGCYSFANTDSIVLRMEAEWLLLGATSSDGATELQNTLRETQALTTTLTAVASSLLPLPVSGLLLFKVLAVHERTEGEAEAPWAPASAATFPGMDSSASQMKGWMSCWVRVDRASKCIVFFDQGPGSAPSLSVNCELATLHIPDLTDSNLGCECNLYHCDVLNSPVRAKMSLAIKLPNAEELFRWAMTFASLLDNVTYCSGGIVNAATQAIDYLQEAPLPPLGTLSAVSSADFPGNKPFVAEICLGVLEGLAERRMCSSYIRNVKLNGAQIKSARFLQMNQRIVLLMKGTCASLTEGSVLLSVNGLSTVSTPASTILKFIADFPRQMEGELTLWKFPRMEFCVDVVSLTASSSSNATPSKPTDVNKLSDGVSSLQVSSMEESKLFDPISPKSKLNKVMIQKRNSILKINSGQEMSYEGIAYPSVLANLQSDIKPSEAELAAAAELKEKAHAEASYTLADFSRTSVASEVKWQSCRFMVASGNISMLVSGDCGVDVLLCRLQLSSCQMKLVYPAYGTNVEHLCIHLRDAKSQVVVRCPSVSVFIDLSECLLIALKMMGSFPADLAHLYDQSVNWKNSEERANAATSASKQSLLMQSVLETSEATNGSRTALSASLLSPLRGGMMTPVSSNRSLNEEGNEFSAATLAPESSILQAAEELEQTLSALHLPLNFPTHSVVEKELVELFKLNNANHRLLAEFMTLQCEVMNPIPETAEMRKKSMSYGHAAEEDKYIPPTVETKYPSMSSTPTREYEEEEDKADAAPAKDLDTVLRDKLMSALLTTQEKDKEKENDKDKENDRESKDGERSEGTLSGKSSREITEEDAAELPVPRITPPSPRETVAPVRRASVQMRSGSVLMGSATTPNLVQQQSSANRRATFRKSAITHSQEQAAVLLMSEMEKRHLLQSVLNKGDRAAISVLLNYLRNSPQDLVNIAVRFTSPTDVAGLAHFVVHRLCVYWSAEQRSLEDVIFTAATTEAPQHGRSFTDALNNKSDSSKTGLMFSSQSLLTRLSNSANASGGSFLQALLNEITHRLDVVVYIQSLCEGINVDSLTQDSGVADLCARVVEPFCRRFEAAVVSGTMPIVLKHALKALVRCESAPIKPLDFISDSILPHILNAIVSKNKQAESLNRPTLTDEQVQVILDRVRDLVNMCFNQDVARHLKICLSDQAALSRSKWYIEKSLQYIVQDSRNNAIGLGGGKEATLSPIAKLAQIETSSGKSSAIHGMICVRPSELFFILQSMELSNISAAPLSAYSKELSQAITHMHTSDLLQRLHSELRLTPVPVKPSPLSISTTLHVPEPRRTGILDAMKESGIPALDRELTFLLHISPHGVYHSEFMHHFNDDSAIAIPPSKGRHGHSSAASKDNSFAIEPDLVPLLSSESIEESPEAHALASIRWLVQASRSALKSMYEHNSSSISKNQSVVRELQELRSKLLARTDEIAGILADWKKISICMEVCSNFKAQIGLLLEKYKYHKKIAQQASQSAVYWNASGVGGSGDNSSSEAAPSTVALLEASANLTSAVAQKDAEVQETLAKIVMLQLKLEGELQRVNYSAEIHGLFTAKNQSNSMNFDQDAGAGPVHSASKLAALAANSPLHARSPRKNDDNSFFGNKSPTASAPSYSSRGYDDYVSGAMRRAPNPLHVVMQSVFASSAATTPQKS